MRFILGWLNSVSAVLLAAVIASNASAGMIVNFTQVGNDVVATLSGSLSNLSGGTIATQPVSNFIQASSSGNAFAISTGSGIIRYDLNRAFGVWSSMNPLFESSSNISLSGLSYFRVSDNPATARLTIGGYSGGTVTGQASFASKTFVDMGLPTVFTEYVYTLSNGGDTVKIQFGTPDGGGGGQVPEPSTMAIFSLGVLGMAYRARRKAKA